ncbi:efflux RND transporter permease subunit, partial [Myxococcota bacterium]|nr:efflux RND transporter permease subunit [Myxococcota bacterium]
MDERTVVTLNKFESPKDVEKVILRSSFTGQSVRVGDVATTHLHEKDETFIVRNNGQEGMSLVVRKKVDADIIRTLDHLKKWMAERTLPEGVTFSYSNDQSKKTRLRLQVLSSNALMGFALVLIFLMLALGWRTAIWTAMSIPFSLLGGVIVISQMGLTLTSIALAGFVLVLGILVDDAIVVAEKISQYREEGFSALEAAQKGAYAMWQPVLVASLTTMLAFYPMFYLGGRPGKFAWAIPAVVIVALIVSAIDTFFLLPEHLAGGKKVEPKPKAAWLVSLESAYARSLSSALRWRYLVLALAFILLAGGGILAKKKMRFQMFPQDGVEAFYVKLEMPQGASLKAVQERLVDVEKAVAKLPETELESYSTRVGTLSTDASRKRGEHSHWGVVSIYLTGEAERDRSADEIITEVRGAIETSEGEAMIFEKARVGPPIGNPIEIQIASNNDALREQTSKEIQDFLKAQPGVLDVESDNKPGKKQLVVDINYKRLAEVDLRVKDVADALRVTFDGMLVSSTTSVEETLDYRVIMGHGYRGNPDMIYKIPVNNARGQVLTLRDVLSLREAEGPLEFHHVDGIRTETITGDINIKESTVAKVEKDLRAEFGAIWAANTDLKVTTAGEARESKKIIGGFGSAALLSLISIFFIVAILLNSLGQPIIVMSVIPFSVVGVIFALFFHGMTISFFAIMGMLGLVGVVVNDTIIMVTESNSERANNPDENPLVTIVAGARTRLRPVLLTTLTTVAGLLPTAYGIGGRDGLIMPLTLAMAWGLLFATLITLVLTPTMIAVG